MHKILYVIIVASYGILFFYDDLDNDFVGLVNNLKSSTQNICLFLQRVEP